MKTAEFVSPKHPDKMCDQISDAILDWALARDPKARVAIETMGGHGKVYIVGELKVAELAADSYPLHTAAEEIVKRITGKEDLEVIINVVEQSAEIANGVDTGGAGDQGIMRGYAVADNLTLMPLEYELARSICKRLYEKWPYDGKTQVTIDDRGVLHTIVASFQNVKAADLKAEIENWIIESDDMPLGWERRIDGIIIHANPAGDWSVGGFDADTGLTGRKLMVDNYGPRLPIGGGAFSGKDATKVDRSAAYMARKIAVDYMREHPAPLIEVEIAYAIGLAQPVAAYVKSGKQKVDLLAEGKYDLTPAGIIKALELDKPQYEETARWGHFGHDKNLWK